MNSIGFNKIAGAVLGTLLFLQVIYLASTAMFSHPAPAKPGDNLPATAAGQPAASTAAQSSAPAPDEVLANYVGKAEASKGENDVKVCQLCHNLAKGGGVIIGPPLYGVIGRPRGSVPGFAYSDGMKAKGGTWTPETVFIFIKNPAAYIPGTKMTFAGEPSPEKRADIVAYIDTLSDHPVPLPKPAK